MFALLFCPVLCSDTNDIVLTLQMRASRLRLIETISTISYNDLLDNLERLLVMCSGVLVYSWFMVTGLICMRAIGGCGSIEYNHHQLYLMETYAVGLASLTVFDRLKFDKLRIHKRDPYFWNLTYIKRWHAKRKVMPHIQRHANQSTAQ
jgi:hypothetical protein